MARPRRIGIGLQAMALDREARRRGTARSHLIREAIDQAYVVDPDRERVMAGLRIGGRLEGPRGDR